MVSFVRHLAVKAVIVAPMHCPRAITLLFLTLSLLGATAAAPRQDAKPASPAPAPDAEEWIDDQKLQQTLMEGAVALIEAGRAPEVSEVAKGLATPACELDLLDDAAPATEPPAAGHAAPAKGRVESEALYEQARKSVVVVGSAYKCTRCTNWHLNGATGFMLTADGALVTNYHVVDQADKRALVAMTSDGRVFPVVEALARDEKTDVAILRLEPVDQHGEKATFSPARLAEKSRVGQSVRVVHHADGRYYTLTEGIVSRRYTDRHRGGSRWMTITADYAKGSSGGPLFNDAGEVIGIVASTSSVYYDQDEEGTPQNLQMVWKQCVPVENIRKLIE